MYEDFIMKLGLKGKKKWFYRDVRKGG